MSAGLKQPPTVAGVPVPSHALFMAAKHNLITLPTPPSKPSRADLERYKLDLQLAEEYAAAVETATKASQPVSSKHAGSKRGRGKSPGASAAKKAPAGKKPAKRLGKKARKEALANKLFAELEAAAPPAEPVEEEEEESAADDSGDTSDSDKEVPKETFAAMEAGYTGVDAADDAELHARADEAHTAAAAAVQDDEAAGDASEDDAESAGGSIEDPGAEDLDSDDTEDGPFLRGEMAAKYPNRKLGTDDDVFHLCKMIRAGVKTGGVTAAVRKTKVHYDIAFKHTLHVGIDFSKKLYGAMVALYAAHGYRWELTSEETTRLKCRAMTVLKVRASVCVCARARTVGGGAFHTSRSASMGVCACTFVLNCQRARAACRIGGSGRRRRAGASPSVVRAATPRRRGTHCALQSPRKPLQGLRCTLASAEWGPLVVRATAAPPPAATATAWLTCWPRTPRRTRTPQRTKTTPLARRRSRASSRRPSRA